jgi:hypothetical protein
MSRPTPVADRAANKNELIAQAAEVIGGGQRREVYKAIYHHKSKVKTVAQIASATKLTRQQVLNAGKKLADAEIVHQTKTSETAYEQIPFYQTNKQKIFSLTDPKKRAVYPTKRNPGGGAQLPKIIRLPTAGAKIKRVTIDDIDSLAKVKRVKAKSYLADTLSEDDFKQGMKKVLGELGVFKDRPDETSDLYSSHASMKGKRRAVAFAFKGPGLKGKLVPGKMGRNGDQIQRLFREDADIYIAQHCRQIDPSVVQQMQAHAVARSVLTGNLIYYGVIDGTDSERLRLAYPAAFVATKKKKPARAGRRK